MENELFNTNKARQTLKNLEQLVGVKEGLIFQNGDVTPDTVDGVFIGTKFEIQKPLKGKHPQSFSIIQAESNIAYALLNSLLGNESAAKNTLKLIETELKSENGLLNEIGYFKTPSLSTNSLYGLVSYTLGEEDKANKIAEKILETFPLRRREDTFSWKHIDSKQLNMQSIDKDILLGSPIRPYHYSTKNNALYATLNSVLGNINTAKNLQESIKKNIGNYQIMKRTVAGWEIPVSTTSLINNEKSGKATTVETEANASFMLLNQLLGNYQENKLMMQDLNRLVPRDHQTNLFYSGNRINGFETTPNLLLGILYASNNLVKKK